MSAFTAFVFLNTWQMYMKYFQKASVLLAFFSENATINIIIRA